MTNHTSIGKPYIAHPVPRGFSGQIRPAGTFSPKGFTNHSREQRPRTNTPDALRPEGANQQIIPLGRRICVSLITACLSILTFAACQSVSPPEKRTINPVGLSNQPCVDVVIRLRAYLIVDWSNGTRRTCNERDFDALQKDSAAD